MSVRLGDITLRASQGSVNQAGPARAVLRPERIQLLPHGETGPNRVPGMVERLVYLGSTTQVLVRLAAGTSVQAMVPNTGDALPWQQGTPVSVLLPPEALRLLPLSA